MGPGNIDNWVEQQVNTFLESDGGWLVLNVHGLDDEGWGPYEYNLSPKPDCTVGSSGKTGNPAGR
ncbi:MAG: hypothetical protein GVY20_03640 [Bacteroidetes bacterium]|jgi:hypothetical protein|nr:hypothetical protein [Bacteroidota bacterium]